MPGKVPALVRLTYTLHDSYNHEKRQINLRNFNSYLHDNSVVLFKLQSITGMYNLIKNYFAFLRTTLA